MHPHLIMTFPSGVLSTATEPNSFKAGSLLTDATDPQWGISVILCDVTPPSV